MPTNQLEKKQFPKDLALVGCTTLRSVTLTIAGWECYILLLPPVGDPNKRSPQFSLVFSGSETVFVWIPKNNALFWLLLRKKKKKRDSWKLHSKRAPHDVQGVAPDMALQGQGIRPPAKAVIFGE